MIKDELGLGKLVERLRNHARDCELLDMPEGRPSLIREAADAITALIGERDALDPAELQLLMRLRDNQQSNVHDVVESDQEMWARGRALSDRGFLAMLSHPKGGTFHITRLGLKALASTLNLTVNHDG